MNQKQTDFAVKRAEAIFKNRLSVLHSSYHVPAVRMTTAQKLTAIRAKHFTVPDSEVEPYRWWEAVAFDGEEAEYMREGWEEAQARLVAQKNRLVDQLMLGSTSEALVLLDAFGRGEDLPA